MDKRIAAVGWSDTSTVEVIGGFSGHCRTSRMNPCGMVGLVLSATLAVCSAQNAVADTPELTAEQKAALQRYFGFGEMSLFKIDQGISNLTLADLNNDSLTDVVMVNNRRSRIEVLYQRERAEPATRAVGSEEDDVNALLESGQFRRENISSAYTIASLLVLDVTGDGLNDLVFYGRPPELVTMAGRKDGTFDPPTGIRVSEPVTRTQSLVKGDFNGDGRVDVALLGEKNVLLFAQGPAGKGLERPTLYPHGADDFGLIFAEDLDGDGRTDLIIGGSDSAPVAVRFQLASGRLGPQVRFDIPEVRSITPGPAARGSSRVALYCIENRSGRLKRYVYDPAPATTGGEKWASLIYAYVLQSKERRPLAIGDLTGDGLADFVACDPDSAQVILYRQNKPYGLDEGEVFPFLIKPQDLTLISVKGKPALLVTSREEKTIGLSRYDGSRITFPAALLTAGEPQCATAGVMDRSGEPKLVYISRSKNADGDTTYSLYVQPIIEPQATTDATTQPATQPVGAVEVSLPSFDSAPNAVRVADANQDGLADVLIFAGFEPITTALQNADGTFSLLSNTEATGRGLVKDARVTDFAYADVTGDGKPEILLTQKSFARALKIAGGRWTVVDQFNPAGSGADLSAITVLTGDPKAPATEPRSKLRVLLYDKKGGEISVLSRDKGEAFEVTGTIPVGTFEGGLFDTSPLRGDDTLSVLLADNSKFAVISPDVAPPQLRETAYFEPESETAVLIDSVIGDLNRDGVPDIGVIEGRQSMFMILTTGPSGELIRASRFRFFEEKSFRRGGGNSTEPREFRIGDVTNDGRQDLVVIAHDRVIIYPTQ